MHPDTVYLSRYAAIIRPCSGTTSVVAREQHFLPRERAIVVNVSVIGDRIRFEMEGWDKLWALRSQLEIPLEHVKSVRIDPEAARGWWHGLKLAGTNIPGILAAGTFYQSEGAVFFDVKNPERSIVFDLDHEFYKRLVIEVENTDETVELVKAAIAHSST
jgi:hypothetical protein